MLRIKNPLFKNIIIFCPVRTHQRVTELSNISGTHQIEFPADIHFIRNRFRRDIQRVQRSRHFIETIIPVFQDRHILRIIHPHILFGNHRKCFLVLFFHRPVNILHFLRMPVLKYHFFRFSFHPATSVSHHQILGRFPVRHHDIQVRIRPIIFQYKPSR